MARNNGMYRNSKEGLSPRERKQLLFWGTLLIIAMLFLIYFTVPSRNIILRGPQQGIIRSARCSAAQITAMTAITCDLGD